MEGRAGCQAGAVRQTVGKKHAQVSIQLLLSRKKLGKMDQVC
jgi:hypothetical protein